MNWEYRHTVLGLCMFAFFATMVARLAISPLVPWIIADFRVSTGLVGAALSGMWVAYAVVQFPSGVVTDRYGERRVILVAVGGTAVGSVLLAVSPVFGVFVVSAVVIGLMAGFHYTPATVLLSRMYRNAGTAVGVHSFGSPLAGLLAPIAAVWIGARYGWRPAVAVTVLVAVPVFVLVAWRVRDPPPRRPNLAMREEFQAGRLVQVLARRRVAFTLGVMVAGGFVWQGTAAFLPTFLVEFHGQSPTVAGVAFSAYFVVHGVTMVLTGMYADRFGPDVVIGSCMLAGTVGFAAFVLGSGAVVLVAAVGLIGVGLSSYPAMITRLLREFVAAEEGTGLGLVRTVSGVLSASGPVVVGVFADVFGWAVAFGLLTVVLVVVVGAVVMNRVFRFGY